MIVRALASALFSVAVAATVNAQSPPRPAFAAASVKPSARSSQSIGPAGERLVATGAPLRLLIQYAYRSASGRPLLDSQIAGAPRWVENDPFDVQATAGTGSGGTTQRQLQLMTQSLLEDRFQLRTHREMRELPVYSLIVSKGGLKMKPSADQTPISDDGPPRIFDPAAAPRGRFRTIGKPSASGAITLVMTGTAISARVLMNVLQQYLDRPIVDLSGLEGLYDVALEFGLIQSQPVAADDSASASIFTAVQEQLGLKLDAVKMPVEVLVIDHAERPSAD